MTNNFYTSAVQYGNKILVRSIQDGLPHKAKIDFYPTLFTTSKKPSAETSKWKSLYGIPVYEINPGSINDCKEFIKSYEHVEGFNILGQTNYAYQYIAETYSNDIKFDSDLLKIVSIDIETADEEEGFPKPKYANEEILLIGISDMKTKTKKIFGTRPYTGQYKESYVLCQDESSLLKQFIAHWQERVPDIVSGWNINFFDMPYIVNRINKVLGSEYSKKLSVWNIVHERMEKLNDDEVLTVDIVGTSCLDYLDLYKKYSMSTEETYKLDHIAYIVLGERKVDHSEWNSFKEFYSNNFELFTDYNAQDVELINRLDDELKFIELHLTMAYMAKINYSEAFSPVRLWDATIYHYLLAQNIVIPNQDRSSVKGELEGAFVKPPQLGFHNWVASFDLASLYPHLIMQSNISPETITTTRHNVTIDGLLNKMELPKTDYAVTANGWCYSKEKRGFLPQLMDTMYVNRSIKKKEMLKLEQQREQDKSNKELSKEITRLHNIQMALKITLNSAYGALGMPYFRYYDLRMAEGITTGGQLSIKWIAAKLNKYLNSAMKTTDYDYIIAMDTDSCYISLAKLIDSNIPDKTTAEKIQFMDTFCSKVLTPYIAKSYTELAEYLNSYDQKMQMKREVLADKGLWTAKKRYALRVHNSEGVQYDKPKMKIMGIDIVKATTPPIIKDKLKQTLDIIFDQTNDDLIKFIDKTKKEFKTYNVEDIAIAKSVNGMANYQNDKTIFSKGCPLQVRAGLLYNHTLKTHNLTQKYPSIASGDKLKYVFLKLPNTLKQNVIGFPGRLPEEFNLSKYIDYDTQFEKVFLKPLGNIIKPIGWHLEEVSSLDAFF